MLQYSSFKIKEQNILIWEKEREKEGRGKGESKAEYNGGIPKCRTFLSISDKLFELL